MSLDCLEILKNKADKTSTAAADAINVLFYSILFCIFLKNIYNKFN